MEFKGKNFALIGFGVSNSSLAKYLIKKEANIYIFDEKYDEELDLEQIEKLSQHGKVSLFNGDKYEDNNELEGIDILVVSPHVDPKHPKVLSANNKNIPIYVDVSLFLEIWDGRGPVIGVSGSNGKSTIVTLLNKIFEDSKKKVFLGGNIGTSPFDWVDDAKDDDIAVLELSSFQLEYFNENHFVDYAIITNISDNHLDRHGNSISEYAKVKLKMVKPKHTKLVIDVDDSGIQKYVTPNLKDVDVIPVSLETISNEVDYDGVYTNSNGDIVIKKSEEETIVFPYNSERYIKGLHNLYNIACTLGLVQYFDLDTKKVIESISDFKGLPHRIQFVDEIDGVTYINDSKATSPDATIKALEALDLEDKSIILIVGGKTKGAKFDVWKPYLEKYVKHMIILPGTAYDIFASLAEDCGIDFVNAESMDEAVKHATEFSSVGDAVILSPGVGYGIFANFNERGEKFIESVSRLRGSK